MPIVHADRATVLRHASALTPPAGEHHLVQAYRYPDCDDRCANAYERTHEPYAGYCQRAEDFMLTRAERFIGNTSRRHLLDVGCGTGRMLPRFAPRFSRVLGIDPDHVRARHASDLVARAKLTNVTIMSGDIDDLCERAVRFDVALCSHVIQHVSRSEAFHVVDIISELLRPLGTLILLTSQSRDTADAFVECRFAQHQSIVETIRPKHFDAIARSKSESLPVRMFALSTLKRLIEARFQVRAMWPYQHLSPMMFLDRLTLRDRMSVVPWIKRNFGTNVMVIATLKGTRISNRPLVVAPARS